MKGWIKIEGLKIHCVFGQHTHERDEDQEITVDLKLQLDITKCVQTDRVADTVDYTHIARLLIKLAKEKEYHLLETFAFEALELLFKTFPIFFAKICVKKRGALPLAKYAAVELEKGERE